MCFIASSGAGAQEAFQLLVVSGNVSYAIYYLLMFAVPLVTGTRFGKRPALLLRAACLAGIAVTVLSVVMGLIPVVEVAKPWIFALKVMLTALAANLVGAGIYWRGSRQSRIAPAPVEPVPSA